MGARIITSLSCPFLGLWLTQVGTCGMVKTTLAIPSLESVFCCYRYFPFLCFSQMGVAMGWGEMGACGMADGGGKSCHISIFIASVIFEKLVYIMRKSL